MLVNLKLLRRQSWKRSYPQDNMECQKRGKKSEYAVQLMEKQKAKYTWYS
jgi:hypothetical protein